MNEEGSGMMLVVLLVLASIGGMFMSIIIIIETNIENERLTEQLNIKERACYNELYNITPQLGFSFATSSK